LHRPFFGRDIARTGAAEIGLLVPPEEVFPGVVASEKARVDVLAGLSRDDVLFHCGRVNTFISGPGDFDVKGRQQQTLYRLCTPDQIGRINAFAKRYSRSGPPPAVFFRGQLLELMRWAARHCKSLPGDGETFTDPEVRSRFVQAALNIRRTRECARLRSERWRRAHGIMPRKPAQRPRLAMGVSRVANKPLSKPRYQRQRPPGWPCSIGSTGCWARCAPS